ncbi:hypothetical protein FHS18_001810 [Paenibacillus phyllosphaerae]|uniref:Phosphoribosyltransferase n=1 Tax=Paenibacillus phyllosphaerae TaxID=274593 RepID=A0A7W5AW43_9BACL|nr:phosphoribosyltransferase family protein [Paenibacillus phyllosphaerae]MBB3109747.1 hypothetical protein [Paenibacillus phyllosphaerae]
MNNNIISACSQSKSTHTFNILHDLSVTITLQEEQSGLQPEALFGMAARINKKRSFLFVSKVLGKHLPVSPHRSLLSGAILSLKLLQALGTSQAALVDKLFAEACAALADPDETKVSQVYSAIVDSKLALPEPVKVIGFAETATALGHSMFAAFEDGCSYLHTTRELIPELDPLISFEEEHSHATSHRCYARSEQFLGGTEPIVLVDDELTTGKTTVNIIRDLQRNYPRSRYFVASLLDWRGAEDEARFAALEQELGITITPLSLMKGTFTVEGGPIDTVAARMDLPAADGVANLHVIYLDEALDLVRHASVSMDGYRNEAPYLLGTGRFGITAAENVQIGGRIAAVGERLAGLRTSSRTLCLGTGEYMYMPMLIASHMGEGVRFHSTTRSPIHSASHETYAVDWGVAFPSPDDTSVTNYIYNIAPSQYEELFLFLERDIPAERLAELKKVFLARGFRHVHLVIGGPNIHEGVTSDDDR